jgi:hypothetical protein
LDEFTEFAQGLGNLQMKIHGICNDSPYPSDDLRHGIFLHVLGIIQPSIIIWNLLIAVNKNQIADATYKSIFGMEKEWVPQQFGALENFSCTAIITVFHFVLEIFLKNILAKLEKKNPPQQFNKISKQILAKIMIDEDEIRYQTFMTLSNIRNGYHSNGVHTNDTCKLFKINELEYQFVQGEPIECITSKHVLVLLDKIISIMEEIVATEKVHGIKENIPDQYVPEYE